VTNPNQRPVVWWLFTACLLIFLMVVVGGITRLTRSGLSMVEWHPVTGVIPPLTAADWEIAFEKYRQYPEYQVLNRGMTLAEFKSIFFWEYLHRLLGRIIGLVFLIPFAIFYYQKRLAPPLLWKLLLMFLLGALQGLVGWFMVKSGLADNPYVSHYRLALHLLLAVGLITYIFWTALDLIPGAFRRSFTDPAVSPERSRLRTVSWSLTGLILLQLIYGAFTAGLKAGHGWNTFPTMAGEWIPTGLLSMHPWWKNLLEHNLTVQFIHRCLGWLLVITIPLFWFYARRADLTRYQRWGINGLLGVVLVQFLLGVFTLLWVVPVGLGVLHQAGAVILFMTAVYTGYVFTK
jgi:cytochrome c oxidase assembly protein subunit 15